MTNNPSTPYFYLDPMLEKYRESELRINEQYKKAEVDLSKSMTWLEVSTNIKVDLQTQRAKVYFDDAKGTFYAMIPQVRASSVESVYKLRKLFDAEDFESETWTIEDNLGKLVEKAYSEPIFYGSGTRRYNEATGGWTYNGYDSRPYGSMYVGEVTPGGYTVNADGAWLR